MQRNVKRKERNRDAEQGRLKSIAKKLADFVRKNPKEIRKNPKEGGKEEKYLIDMSNKTWNILKVEYMFFLIKEV